MKKMLICCGVLCMTLLLFCGSALAAVEIKSSDSSVTVTQDADGKVFTVTKTGATSDKLYLVMVQKGTASDKPTAENLYYLNVEKASGTTLTISNVYPKDLDGGDYVVFLSDYSGTNNGARQAVATITGGSTTLYGDVNGDGTVNGKDRGILARYLAKWPDYGPDKTDDSYKVVLANSDVNQDGNVNGQDRGILARHLAKWPDYATLPMPKS